MRDWIEFWLAREVVSVGVLLLSVVLLVVFAMLMAWLTARAEARQARECPECLYCGGPATHTRTLMYRSGPAEEEYTCNQHAPSSARPLYRREAHHA